MILTFLKAGLDLSLKPETLFRQKVVKDLTALDHVAIFSIQQRSIKGDPDLLICARGVFLALELKSEKGKASKLQEFKLDKIRKAGGVAFVVYPDNWGTILELIQQLTKDEL